MQKIVIFVLVIFMMGCVASRNYMKIPEGAAKQKILIKSQPTESVIYIDDHYLGMTPIRTNFWYTKERMINIKAVPIHESQYAQNIYMRIPPVPDEMTVYLDFKFLSSIGMTLPGEIEEEVDEDVDSVQVITEIIVERDTLFSPIILPTLFFDTDIDTLSASELKKLPDVVRVLESYPTLKLEIMGSADKRGSDEYNRQLAKSRATNVRNQLIDLGVEPARMAIVVQVEYEATDEDDQILPYQLQRSVGFRIITE